MIFIFIMFESFCCLGELLFFWKHILENYSLVKFLSKACFTMTFLM